MFNNNRVEGRMPQTTKDQCHYHDTNIASNSNNWSSQGSACCKIVALGLLHSVRLQYPLGSQPTNSRSVWSPVICSSTILSLFPIVSFICFDFDDIFSTYSSHLLKAKLIRPRLELNGLTKQALLIRQLFWSQSIHSPFLTLPFCELSKTLSPTRNTSVLMFNLVMNSVILSVPLTSQLTLLQFKYCLGLSAYPLSGTLFGARGNSTLNSTVRSEQTNDKGKIVNQKVIRKQNLITISTKWQLWWRSLLSFKIHL